MGNSSLTKNLVGLDQKVSITSGQDPDYLDQLLNTDYLEVSSNLLKIKDDLVLNTLELDNDLTDHGLYIHQDGALASSKHGLYVYSNAAQTNATLVQIHNDNASSTRDTFSIEHDGTEGQALSVGNNGTHHGIYLNQAGVLASNKHALYVYSNAAQTNSPLVNIHQDNASSTQSCLVITQDGNESPIYISTTGCTQGLTIANTVNSASYCAGIYTYVNNAHATAPSCMILGYAPNEVQSHFLGLGSHNYTAWTTSKNPATDAPAGWLSIYMFNSATTYLIPYYAKT